MEALIRISVVATRQDQLIKPGYVFSVGFDVRVGDIHM